MDAQHKKALDQNREVVLKLIQEYEDLKLISNCNFVNAIAANYFVMEFNIQDDEHATTLGI